jgi:serine/threonine protein kinase
LSKCVTLTYIPIDIKSDNILQEIEDKSILESFTQAELKSPSPRKTVNDLPIYASRRFDLPKVFGRAVLSDFGSAVQGVERRNHDAQPNIYRSPEVMLKTDWSYPVDIWNVGAMVCSSYSLLSLIIRTNRLGIIGVGFV